MSGGYQPKAGTGKRPDPPTTGSGVAVRLPATAKLDRHDAGADGPKRRVEADPPPVRVAAVKREEKPAMPVTQDEDLLAKNVAQASTSALARLTRAAAPEDRQPAPLVGQGLTVDQLVMELLKPQLKDWLEQHLPSIVERVVEQEVKKLARRAELL